MSQTRRDYETYTLKDENVKKCIKIGMGHFPLADVLFYVAERVCLESDVIYFENFEKCNRMGIIMLKYIIIREGKSSTL